FAKLNVAETDKGVTVRGDGFFSNNQGSKMKQALNDAWAFLYPMLPYVFIGVVIGAFIYGFMPADFITKYASGDGIFSVMFASVIGVTMYIRHASMFAFAGALVSDRMGRRLIGS